MLSVILEVVTDLAKAGIAAAAAASAGDEAAALKLLDEALDRGRQSIATRNAALAEADAAGEAALAAKFDGPQASGR